MPTSSVSSTSTNVSFYLLLYSFVILNSLYFILFYLILVYIIFDFLHPFAGRGVKYWEPFNEKDMPAPSGTLPFYLLPPSSLSLSLYLPLSLSLPPSSSLPPPSPFLSVTVLAQLYLQVANAMKAVDPSIIVGGPTFTFANPGNTPAFLSVAGSHILLSSFRCLLGGDKRGWEETREMRRERRDAAPGVLLITISCSFFFLFIILFVFFFFFFFLFLFFVCFL